MESNKQNTSTINIRGESRGKSHLRVRRRGREGERERELIRRGLRLEMWDS